MKILGIGVDIIENNRIKNSIKNHKFRDRIYSKNELELKFIFAVNSISKFMIFDRIFNSIIFDYIDTNT